MRFDTNFTWAYFAPAILISVVSYVSVFHNHSSKCDLRSKILPFRTEHTTVEYHNENLMTYLREKIILRIICCTTYIYL